MSDDEAEKRYQAFLQRQQAEEAKKGLTSLRNQSPPAQIIELTEEVPKEINVSEVPITKEQEARAAEVTEQLKATMRKNLKASFYIELQIASGEEKDVATNKKLRYEFAKLFVTKHWVACITSGLKIKDLLNV